MGQDLKSGQDLSTPAMILDQIRDCMVQAMHGRCTRRIKRREVRVERGVVLPICLYEIGIEARQGVLLVRVHRDWAFRIREARRANRVACRLALRRILLSTRCLHTAIATHRGGR